MQRAREPARALARELADVAHLLQDARRTLSDLAPLRRQPHALGSALQKLQAKLAFELLDLHGQRGLRDGAVLGRAAEMAETSHRIEVAQLLEGGHGTSISYSYPVAKLNRLELMNKDL